jgi:hypothetical protein
VKLSRRQLDVLRKLADGYVMDSTGSRQMGGLLIRGRQEHENVSALTINALYVAGCIGVDHSRISNWTITERGRTLVTSNNMSKKQE